MSKTVKVTYNTDTLETTIVVDGKNFDTSRITGKEIADWAYPFMVHKVRWDGFYDEMVTALGGEKAFDLVFEGSDEALAELKEAWEDAPVNVVSGEQENIVAIAYDADALTTEIIVNGQPFDTSRINGKDIEDWVYPFMMRKVKWDGIFDELKNVLGTDEYEIQFSGSRAAMKVLMEECPEMVAISFQKSKAQVKIQTASTTNSALTSDRTSNGFDYDESKIQELWENSEHDLLRPMLLTAAEKGISDAQRRLGIMYRFGQGVDADLTVALGWYLKAAEQGDSNSMLAVAEIYAGVSYFGEADESIKDTIKAEEWFEKAVAASDESDLGIVYDAYSRFLLDQDRKNESFEMLIKASDSGNDSAAFMLGNIYYFGSDTYDIDKDDDMALKYYSKGAEVDDPDGVCVARLGQVMIGKGEEKEGFANLTKALSIMDSDKDSYLDEDHVAINNLIGQCYFYGIGTSKKTNKAKNHFEISTEYDDALAMYFLGLVFLDEGNGGQAKSWLQKAADNDFADALVTLGYMYLNGNAVKQNYQRAYDYFKKAVNQGNEDAQYAIGNMYYEGLHVRQNYDEAVRRYRKAAEKGVSDAKAMLGLCYLCGTGITQNDEYGADLLEEAAEEGSELAAEMIDKYNKAYDEAYNNASNSSTGGGFDKLINTANDFIKSDKGQAVLKKAGKGALMGAASGLAGGTPISVLGGAVKGAAGAAFTAFAADDDEDE